MLKKDINYFNDKVTWITGASSGIGESLAYELSKHHSMLIITARNKEALERVKNNCICPGKVKILQGDLSMPNSLQVLTGSALQFFGRIDIVIHNAGIASKDLVENTPSEIDRKIMELNYFAPVIITKALLPEMLKRKSGHIVVISSLSGKYGVPKLSAYAASKHALHGFFESLRAEVSDKNIKVSMIIPGFINTEITRKALLGNGEAYGKKDIVVRKGMSPGSCAGKMIKAIAQGKAESLIGGAEVWSVRIKNLFPSLFALIIRNHPLKKYRKIKSIFTFKTHSSWKPL
jgi:short-subunit dehydrogenase